MFYLIKLNKNCWINIFNIIFKWIIFWLTKELELKLQVQWNSTKLNLSNKCCLNRFRSLSNITMHKIGIKWVWTNMIIHKIKIGWVRLEWMLEGKICLQL